MNMFFIQINDHLSFISVLTYSIYDDSIHMIYDMYVYTMIFIYYE